VIVVSDFFIIPSGKAVPTIEADDALFCGVLLTMTGPLEVGALDVLVVLTLVFELSAELQLETPKAVSRANVVSVNARRVLVQKLF
jgi:hypothetical protein